MVEVFYLVYCLFVWYVQCFECFVGYFQVGVEGFVYWFVYVQVYQVEGVLMVVCVGYQFEVWKLFVYQLCDVQVGLWVVGGQYEYFGFVCLCCVQQVWLCWIVEEQGGVGEVV